MLKADSFFPEVRKPTWNGVVRGEAQSDSTSDNNYFCWHTVVIYIEDNGLVWLSGLTSWRMRVGSKLILDALSISQPYPFLGSGFLELGDVGPLLVVVEVMVVDSVIGGRRFGMVIGGRIVGKVGNVNGGSKVNGAAVVVVVGS